MSNMILVGENNPYGSDPEWALYCYPPGCAGYRLRRFLGLPEDQYLALARTNLCSGDWSLKEARERGRFLLSYRVIVMLGRKVAEAFGYDRPFFTHDDARLVSLPHPSGRNASSWSGSAPLRTPGILREVAPEIPWGSINEEVAA